MQLTSFDLGQPLKRITLLLDHCLERTLDTTQPQCDPAPFGYGVLLSEAAYLCHQFLKLSQTLLGFLVDQVSVQLRPGRHDQGLRPVRPGRPGQPLPQGRRDEGSERM